MRDYYQVFNNEMVDCEVAISNNILKRRTPQYQKLCGKRGIIRSVWDDSIGVEIYDTKNAQSKQGLFYFKQNEIIIIDEGEPSMKNETFDNYRGNYVVAKIHYVDDVANAETFARLYDDGMVYETGNYVVAKSLNQYMRVAKIIEIYNENQINSCGSENEIVCPVCIDEYDKRNKRVKEIKKLKAEMDEKVKELQGIALYRLMAQESPELKEMFERFTELTRTDTNNN